MHNEEAFLFQETCRVFSYVWSCASRKRLYMKLCPQCNFENIRNSFYCERCGTLLPSNKAQTTKTTAPARAQESMLPLLEIYTPTPLPPPSPSLSPGKVQPQQIVESLPARTGNVLDLVGRVLLYLVGTLIASLGLFGFLSAFMDEAADIVGFLFLFMSSIVILVIALILHRTPYLRGWQRLVGMFAVTGVIFIVLLIGAAIVSMHTGGSKEPSIIYGGIIIIYGVVLAATALW